MADELNEEEEGITCGVMDLVPPLENIRKIGRAAALSTSKNSARSVLSTGRRKGSKDGSLESHRNRGRYETLSERVAAAKLKQQLTRTTGISTDHGKEISTVQSRSQHQHSKPLCMQYRAYNDPKTGFQLFEKHRLKNFEVPQRLIRHATRYCWLNMNCGSVLTKKKAEKPKPLLTEGEIDAVLQFMDTDGDGTISLPELMLAIRRARRMNDRLLVEGKKVLRKLLELLEQRELSLERWFELMDSSTSERSDGKITTRELQYGMKVMSDEEDPDSPLRFTPKEIDKLLRFMDPNADGDLSLEEVQSAVTRLAQTELEIQVNDIFQRLTAHLRASKVSIQAFFEELDESGDGVVDDTELRNGLEHLQVQRVKEKEEERERQQHERVNTREAWHTCLFVVKSGSLFVYPLHLEFFRGNTGQTGFDLNLLQHPEFEVADLSVVTLKFPPQKAFQSSLLIQLSLPTTSAYIAAPTHVDLVRFMKSLNTNGLPNPPGLSCAFCGSRYTPPLTRMMDDFFLPAPYAPISNQLCCVPCFEKNEANRGREAQANLQFPHHAVEHGLCHSERAHSWRTICSETVVPNRVLAENILHIQRPWSTELTVADE